MIRILCAIIAITLAAMPACKSVEKTVAPSNFREWSPDQATLPYAEFNGDRVTVRNIRNCKYMAEDEFVLDYYDKTYDLGAVQGVDFFMVPFEGMPSLAHTMLSFEFARPGGKSEYLAVSVETRKEVDEKYAAWKGSARQYELMYVVADERDVVELRTNHRSEDVYMYHSMATPEMARRLLVDVLGRVNELAATPEFYDTVGNNCTTNIVRHINRIKPNRITADMRVLLPGYSDKLAFDQGLIERHGTFEETKRAAYLNPIARRYADREDFSEMIRRK